METSKFPKNAKHKIFAYFAPRVKTMQIQIFKEFGFDKQKIGNWKQ